MITRRTDTVAAWADPTVTPRAISKRFLNILVADLVLYHQLGRLVALFAEEPPQLSGPYSHHDGYRT